MNFFAQTRNEIKNNLKSLGFAESHCRSVLSSLYRPERLQRSLDRSFLPNALLALLAAEEENYLTIALTKQSVDDQSIKILYRLTDGQKIESVLMPERGRLTLCISSQVGCQRACSFCDTGRMGLTRNLTVFELISQVHSANRFLLSQPEWLKSCSLSPDSKITNIVFMGMGEPMDNLANIEKSLEIFTDPWAFNLAPRKITVSTAGHLEGIVAFCAKNPNVGIALSLHAADDKKRSKIMPINKEYPLEKVISYLGEYARKANKKILIQYTLIEGLNDSFEDAVKLKEVLSLLPAKVNIIPFNSFERSRFQRPSAEQIRLFSQVLLKAKIPTMIRHSKGQDIAAACGQLALIAHKENIN